MVIYHIKLYKQKIEGLNLSDKEVANFINEINDKKYMLDSMEKLSILFTKDDFMEADLVELFYHLSILTIILI